MQKKVTLELEMESDWTSSVYTRLGDLLAEIEDSEFTVRDVKVEDAYVLKIDSLPVGTFKDVVAKTTNNKRKPYYDDYDGQ